MYYDLATAHLMFILAARDAMTKPGVPSRMPHPVVLSTLSPYHSAPEEYVSRLEECRRWCIERCPQGFHAAAYLESETARGWRFWFSDGDTAFEFKMRFG
jgi:hypothetical protein